jgi:hypothetical protein
VEPSGSSLNSGDVFVVIAEEKLFHWVGKSANIIEKARVSQIVHTHAYLSPSPWYSISSTISSAPTLKWKAIINLPPNTCIF